jgi:hypothetical protein
MKHAICILGTIVILPFFLGASTITMVQPVAGNLTAGSPQQPSGSATLFNIGDYVRLHCSNFRMPGGGNFFVRDAEESWNEPGFNGDDWYDTDDFSFQGPGTWGINALLYSVGGSSKASTGAGGAVVNF